MVTVKTYIMLFIVMYTAFNIFAEFGKTSVQSEITKASILISWAIIRAFI